MKADTVCAFIGDAANRAARIESMCKTLGEPVLLLLKLTGFFPGLSEPLGECSLRGVDAALTLYGLAR